VTPDSQNTENYQYQVIFHIECPIMIADERILRRVRRPGRNVAVQHFLLRAPLGLDGGADRGGRHELRTGPPEKEKRRLRPSLPQQIHEASDGIKKAHGSR